MKDLTYTPDQWLLFFFIYCFIGWIWESSYVSIRKRKLTNRGFMRGPFIPIYGCGCTLMLAVGMPLMDHPVYMYFVGMISATVMEYITGDMMLRIFKVRYWDYSKAFCNIKGHVCLAASLLWGFFALLMNYVARVPIERKVFMIPDRILHITDTVLLIAFVADFALSFKTALDLRDVILAMERIKDEVDRMEKRVDVVIAFADDALIQAKSEISDRVDKQRLLTEERMDELEQRIETARQKLSDMDVKLMMENRLDGASDSIIKKRKEFLDQIAEYRACNEHMRRRIMESAERRGALYRNMIRNNILSSDRFSDSLDEIRKRVEDFKKAGKGEDK